MERHEILESELVRVFVRRRWWSSFWQHGTVVGLLWILFSLSLLLCFKSWDFAFDCLRLKSFSQALSLSAICTLETIWELFVILRAVDAVEQWTGEVDLCVKWQAMLFTAASHDLQFFKYLRDTCNLNLWICWGALTIPHNDVLGRRRRRRRRGKWPWMLLRGCQISWEEEVLNINWLIVFDANDFGRSYHFEQALVCL